MPVQYYAPKIPFDPPMALEDSLRRAYPVREAPASHHLDTLLRHLMERARRMEDRMM